MNKLGTNITVNFNFQFMLIPSIEKVTKKNSARFYFSKFTFTFFLEFYFFALGF